MRQDVQDENFSNALIKAIGDTRGDSDPKEVCRDNPNAASARE
jgi:hypothetical protein